MTEIPPIAPLKENSVPVSLKVSGKLLPRHINLGVGPGQGNEIIHIQDIACEKSQILKKK